MFRRLGRSAQACECYRRALSVAQNERVRQFIERRLQHAQNLVQEKETGAG
jgi:predicted RNA polymerase sigma factor